MYLNESIQTKTLILLLCFLQTPCKYNVSFTKDSKLTGILDIIIITLVVFVLIFFFYQSLMTTSNSALYLQEQLFFLPAPMFQG